MLHPDGKFAVRLADAPLQLPNGIETEIEALWRAEQERRQEAIVNGRIVSALEVAPDGIRGRVVEYRHWIAQRIRPELYDVLMVRPVAVSGLLECADGIIFGRRAGTVTQDPHLWELVPSGGLEVRGADHGGEFDYRAQILRELQEEIGVDRGAVSSFIPFCLVNDPDSHVLDIGIAMTCGLSATAISGAHRAAGSREYEELRIVPSDEVDEFVRIESSRLVGVSAELVRHSGRTRRYSPKTG
jgi:hypothetical protein